ncbi:MAG: recombinase RecT, partial [Candidatus Heimdallarchaeota archaeon]
MTTTSKENGKKEKLAVTQPTLSERFTNMVIKEFTSTTASGDNQQGLTSFHKRLCQNYFIVIDGMLKKAEINRLRKNEYKRDATPVLWDNVNMNQLALDVVASARIGLDPAQPNHINMIPYKNNSTQKYDIVFIIGYRGSELKAKKYGLEVPDDIIVEIVRGNDAFKQIKKDMNNKIETYTFEIKDSNDRGDIVGGFYYYVFDKNPRKNKLRYFTIADIEKRRPKYASVEFWGGEKDKWENGKKVGKEKVDGWFEEMCWKTIYRSA